MLRKREKSDAEKQADQTKQLKPTPTEKMSDTERRASLFPGKREERWIEPLPDTIRFQQKVDKIATLR
jgi:hypothetical protein